MTPFDFQINTLFEDYQGNLWVGSYGLLMNIDSTQRQLEQYLPSPTDSNSISSYRTSVLYEDRNRTLWVGTSFNGLNRMEFKNDVLAANIANKDFNTNALCQAVAMSRTQLHRKLKALTSYSTAAYIRNFRLQRAKQLLETTDMPVGEIALQAGFKDFSHFSRTFHKHFGRPPSEKRK